MLDNGHSVEVAPLLLPTSAPALSRLTTLSRTPEAAAFVASDGHRDPIDRGVDRNGKAIVAALQVMRSGRVNGDLCITVVSCIDITGVQPYASSISAHIRACPGIGSRGGRG